MHTGDSALLLAHTGDIAIAVWTEANANHTRLVNAAVAALEGEITEASGTSEPLPEGFVLREGKGGADAVLSMLTDALEEEVTGTFKQVSPRKQSVSAFQRCASWYLRPKR